MLFNAGLIDMNPKLVRIQSKVISETRCVLKMNAMSLYLYCSKMNYNDPMQ